MNRKIINKSAVIVVIWLGLLTLSGQSQTDTTQVELYQITLKGGSTLIGSIISENDSMLVLQLDNGSQLSIATGEITQRENITGKLKQGEIWNDDPNSSRLLFSPTARALKQGEGYFAVYEVFLPFIAIGVTDFFALAGGMSLFPGADQQIFYISPKITFVETDKNALAAGVIYFRIPDDENGAGIMYGVSTFGDKDNALTVGIGYGFAGDEVADEPVFILGGEARIAKNAKLLTENWIVAGEGGVFSGAVRFFGETLSTDFGVFIPSGSDGVFIPWVGFAYNFGK